MKTGMLLFCGAFIYVAAHSQTGTVNATVDYNIPAKEINCFENFNHNQSPGRTKVNTFLLSKMSQLVYAERLDFEMRKLKNPSSFPSASFRSSSLNSSSNSSFERDFANRFSHWFYNINAKPVKPAVFERPQSTMLASNRVINTDKLVMKNPPVLVAVDNVKGTPVAAPAPPPANNQPSAQERFVADSIAFEKSKPRFKFLNKREDFASLSFATNEIRIPGFDPEVMLVSTEEYILVIWRGTDDVYKGDAWEWIGTDFYFIPVNADGPLAGAKVHAGMWASFKVIRNKLTTALNSFEAKAKNKKIFVTGHSLGGSMALISAPFLEGNGYNVAGVYTFAAPRTIGDQVFVNKSHNLLGKSKIQRFEYGVDPITKIWSPALYFSTFKIPGTRNWYSAVAHSSGDEFYDCGERYFPMTANPLEYNGYSREKIDRDNGDFGLTNPLDFASHLSTVISGDGNRPQDIRQFPLIDFGHHNPTYYTQKAYDVLSDGDKAKLPRPEDTFPYVLPGVRGNK